MRRPLKAEENPELRYARDAVALTVVSNLTADHLIIP